MNLHQRRSSQPKISSGNVYLFVMDCLANGQTGRTQNLYFLNTTSPLHLISAVTPPTVWMFMFSLVITLRATLMFQHKIQESGEYKEFLIVRHILYVKSTYLICIDLLLACGQVIKGFSLKSVVGESCQYLPIYSYCRFHYTETTATKRRRTTSRSHQCDVVC